MSLLDLSLPHAPTHRGALYSFAMKAVAVRRQRAALRRLDTRALEDIGLTRSEADAEASRPFWDVPATWRD